MVLLLDVEDVEQGDNIFLKNLTRGKYWCLMYIYNLSSSSKLDFFIYSFNRVELVQFININLVSLSHI